MLNIIICVKQVPDTENVKFDWNKGIIIRYNVENILNPDDYHAIELGLQLKESNKGIITVITLGPPHAEDILRDAYSFDVDKCILISDEVFAGSDSLITSKILSRAIKKLGKFDIILTGFETIDGNTAQVSYQLAEFLQIPHVTKIHNIEIENNSAIIERQYGHEFQKIKVNLPILIAVNKESNKVRYPKLIEMKKCFDKKIMKMGFEDIGGSKDEYGLSNSPTVTIKGDIIAHKRKKEVFTGDLNDKVEKLILKFKKYSLIRM